MDKPPFFPGDHPALRGTLHRYLDGLSGRMAASEFAGQVELLLLAGGYGRGEGGVFFASDGEGDPVPMLYNDLEFYLLLKNGGDESAARAWCAVEAHRGEAELGIDVEFKILRYEALRRAEPSMFYYDLAAANVRVLGDDAALRILPARLRNAALIPAHEATQLLFNRGTGLLLCEAALRTDSARVRDGFVERNHAKARLAFADAVLALNGRYDHSARERHRRMDEPLTRIPDFWPQLVAWHAEAVEFKFHPRHKNPGREELSRRQDMLVRAWRDVFLWLESARLGEAFADVEAYGSYAGRLFPGSSVWKNGLLHARDAVRRKLAMREWRDYPRAALQRSLALLLGGDEARNCLAASWLKLPVNASREQIEEKYLLGWRYYN